MGRPKGAKNIRSFDAEIMSVRLGIDPFEIMLRLANGDWKGLGYDAESKISYTSSGIEYDELIIKVSDRVQAAKDACKYLYSAKKQDINLTTDPDGFKVIVEEYTSKKND